jgi:hypothetical protein
MDKEERVRKCYDWQINNLQYCRRADKLREELNKTGLVYTRIWQGPMQKYMGRICRKIEENIMTKARDKKVTGILHHHHQQQHRRLYSPCKEDLGRLTTEVS